ncbi:enoyl-CoA hydratase/isomerase family protein [Halorussus sp. AFM4]|uniref:enoyl-CoA hydratase/isomerase family protein n=1 Tax=Halorussus sp. AFM4 TaxID=3421651 RepID=UPI003EB7C694
MDDGDERGSSSGRTAPGDAVRVVTLDRPDRRNALTPDGLDALEAAVTGTERPVVYLRGAGPAFCAGADLDVVAGLDREGAEAFAERGQRVADAIESADSVVVAGVDGPARGGGVELALAADVRVATPDATFAEPGVKLGLFGAWGGTVRLPRVVGEGEALDLALSGRTVDAEEALRMGLVSRVTDDPRAVADELAANDPVTLRTVKKRMRDDSPRAVQERREVEVFGDLVERHADAIADERDS